MHNETLFATSRQIKAKLLGIFTIKFMIRGNRCSDIYSQNP